MYRKTRKQLYDRRTSSSFGYFLPENAEKLLIGSFPCFNSEDYGDWFYSGSGKSDFGNLMSAVFGTLNLTKENKWEISEKNDIAITDIASKVERTKNNCSDANLKIAEVNTVGINKCLAANIKAIYFTSLLDLKSGSRIMPVRHRHYREKTSKLAIWVDF